MLAIQEFVKGRDEKVWIKVKNDAFRDYDDFRPDTLEDMEIWENDPGFDPVGMQIAEFNGQPVGIIQAYIDKQREEKKGFIRTLGVVPEFRGRGIGRKLMSKAIEDLRERGMEAAECWTRGDRPACTNLFESFGFKLIRVFSTMRRDLDVVPSDIGENMAVRIRVMKNDLESIKLLRLLSNETFSEHFDFRPSTLEEWRHWCSHPDFDHEGWFFAILEGKPVGYVGTWIDSKFVKYKGIRRGWIDTIGVLKSCRRMGIGTSLILRGIQHLKSKGMDEVELGVDDTNPTKAIKLYQKVGFRVVRKGLTYLKRIV